MISEFIIFFSSIFEILDVLVFWTFLNQKKFGGFFVGVISLVIFAYLLTKVNLDFTGRAYAVYGGIYIVSSLFWLYFVENRVLTNGI